MITGLFRDYRVYCLLGASLLMLALFIYPTRPQFRPTYNFIVIVDITRSMNAADYRDGSASLSRLQQVKRALHQLLAGLPCQSKIGLGLFTERHSTVLFEPLEVCSAYSEIDSAIAHLDWRMAWAADSRIAKGLSYSLELLQDSESNVVFITDGHEAPPVNPRYQPDFSRLKGKVKGMIIGTGGTVPVPIPKFDAAGKQTGYYTADEVPHRSTFGIPAQSMQDRPGYHSRNAPFGGERAVGNEHLTALRESYLKQLAADAGLGYAHLTDAQSLSQSLQNPTLAVNRKIKVDIRPYYAIPAALLLTLIYLPWNLWRRNR